MYKPDERIGEMQARVRELENEVLELRANSQ